MLKNRNCDQNTAFRVKMDVHFLVWPSQAKSSLSKIPVCGCKLFVWHQYTIKVPAVFSFFTAGPKTQWQIAIMQTKMKEFPWWTQWLRRAPWAITTCYTRNPKMTWKWWSINQPPSLMDSSRQCIRMWRTVKGKAKKKIGFVHSSLDQQRNEAGAVGVKPMYTSLIPKIWMNN